MGLMPYHLEVGRFMSAIADYYNEDYTNPAGAGVARRVADLARLKTNSPVHDSFLLDDPKMHNPSFPDRAAWMRWIALNWFGYVDGPSGLVPPSKPPPPGTCQTGQWMGYVGDVESIVRQTLIRAIEVSFKVGPGGAVPVPPTTVRPMYFALKCPQQWFEGWVYWDHEHVNVAFCHPATPSLVLPSPISADARKTSPGFEVDDAGQAAMPPGSGVFNGLDVHRDQGAWVITHAAHRPRLSFTWVSSGFGRLQLPFCFGGWEPTGAAWTQIVTVSPSFVDGGAKP